MKLKKIFGKTPFIVIINAVITAISVELANTLFVEYKIELIMPICLFFATLLIVISTLAFCSLIFDKRIIKARKEDTLITFGVYAFVMNPLNTAYLQIFTAIIILQANPTILISIFIMYFVQDISLWKEDADLEKKYGLAYIEYRRRVPKNIFRMQKTI